MDKRRKALIGYHSPFSEIFLTVLVSTWTWHKAKQTRHTNLIFQSTIMSKLKMEQHIGSKSGWLFAIKIFVLRRDIAEALKHY